MDKTKPVVIMPRGSPESLAQEALSTKCPVKVLMAALTIIFTQKNKMNETEKRKEEVTSQN